MAIDLSKVKDDDLLKELKRRNGMMFYIACKSPNLGQDDAVSLSAKSKDTQKLIKLIEYGRSNLQQYAKAHQKPIVSAGQKIILPGGDRFN